MPVLQICLLTLAAYLIGSIPTSVWIGKLFYGIDIRQHGSGNAGTTNTFRVLGAKAGIPVFIIDVMKGFVAVSLFNLTTIFAPNTSAFVNVQILLGSFAVVGHIFPIYAHFKGGKGVATLLGMILAIHLPAALLSLCVFIAILLISRYVSLSSLLAGLSFPLLLILLFKVTIIPLIIFSITIVIVLVITHHHNIERLFKREESKANIFQRKRKNRK